MRKSELNERVEKVLQDTGADLAQRVKSLKKLLKEAELSEDLFLVGKINLQLSICYYDLGDRNSLFRCAVKAVDVFEKLGHRNMLAGSYNMLGLAYRAQENYFRAVESYNRALEKIRGLKKPSVRKVAMFSNIAECYYLMGEYEKSSKLLLECTELYCAKYPEDHISAVIFAINLSDNYESLGQYEKALEVLDGVRQHADALHRDVYLLGYNIRRCCALYKLGRYEEGAKYADWGINAVNSGNDSYEFHRDIEKIANLEIEIGDLDRARSFAAILTKYTNDNGHTLDLIVAKRVQAKLFQASGKEKEALLLYRELSELYERRIREQHEVQYESQKNAEAASREIGKLLQKISTSREKAERDPLTGLLNRSALVSITSAFLQIAKEKGRTLGALFMDIDYFKQFNDTYGHAAGDEAIKFVARACLDEETPTVRFFRYGGDEYFGVMLEHKDCELEQIALRISEKVRASGFKHEKNPNGQKLTVSIGIVNMDMQKSDDTILDLIKYADKTLYRAKDTGKNTVFSGNLLENLEQEFKKITAK